MADVLKDALKALGEAVENERSIRFGHEVAAVVLSALLDGVEARAAAEAEPTEHEHAWQVLGWDRPAEASGTAYVIQVCSCSAAQQVSAERALA